MKTIIHALVLASAIVLCGTATAAKMTCTMTGKEVSKCCCEIQKNGKMLCTLTKKTVDKCCCKGM